MTASHRRRPRADRPHRAQLSALARLIGGDILTLPPTCMAFAIHPDRRVVIVTADNVTITLTPGADGLYGITGLIEDVDPTQGIGHGEAHRD